jgi:hypothetical protein
MIILDCELLMLCVTVPAYEVCDQHQAVKLFGSSD